MKTINYIVLATIPAIILGLFACERDYNNPWDGKANLDPNSWAPKNLQIEDISLTEKKLTWTFGENNIEGFKLDRKEGDKEWEVAYRIFDKETRDWIDTDIDQYTEQAYAYKLYAFAGNNNSSSDGVESNITLVHPSYFQLTVNSITSVSLNWADDSNIEDGYKIERKYEGGNWELLNTTTTNNYEDNNFELNTWVYYRVSAYVGEYNSSYAHNNFYATFPAPTNLVITVNSPTSVTLCWQENITGEDGFKIDRKTSEGTWEVEFETLNANDTTFTDESLDLVNNDYNYRLYAFVNTYQSQKIEGIAVLCWYPFTDSRDGHQYEFVQIHNQIWMKENLAYLPEVSPPANGSPSSTYYYVYDYMGSSVLAAKETSNYQEYGVLYNLPAALTACPEGWHLPSDNEWTILIDYLGGESVAGGKMKEVGYQHWNNPNTGATNSSGFTGLPGGRRRDYYGDFVAIGNSGTWWSSTQYQYASSSTWYRKMYYSYGGVTREAFTNSWGHSVRCLRD